jgi:hypothetical protein
MSVLSIKTTAKCQNSCEWCPVIPWMKEMDGFETTIDNIKDLITWSRFSGYQWDKIIFSGGEPLLWPDLKEAARLIQESGIANSLAMYTNALRVDKEYLPEFRAIASYMDTVIISSYPNNQEQIDMIILADIPRVAAYSRPQYYKIPEHPVADSLPAKCGCEGYAMIGDKITLCSFQDHMIAYKGWDMRSFDYETSRLGPNFLEKLSEMDRTNRYMCQFCFGNTIVSEQCETYE